MKTLIVAFSMVLATLVNSIARADDPPNSRAAETDKASADSRRLTWHKSLAPAIEEARRRKAAILVRVGAEWCGWCRRLDKEIADPDLQKELAKWVLVELDADEQADDVRRLNVGPIPALRVLNAGGRTTNSHDGFLPAEKFIEWLRGRDDPVDSDLSDDVTSVAELSAGTVPQLVRLLGHRDAQVREAVMRRLSSGPGMAGAAVAKAFARGNLATRLSALELLGGWQAPIQELDPWRPQTLTAKRLTELEEWADKLDPAANSPGKPAIEPLTPEQLAEARSEIAKLLKADATEVEAIGARLARHGAALLPKVREQRQQAETDHIRERLDWLRYRLAASDALALKWPHGLIKLVSTVAQARHDAASELPNVVASGEEAFLIELFGHPDPFVRELSLKALHGVGGSRANAELARLLADPEPNVRAAVLKQMAEQPSPKLVPQIAAYIAQEKDADLIVHAVRLLREIKGKEAVQCLLKLFEHGSWQVRAEAVDAVGECVSKRNRWGNQNESEESLAADVYAEIIEVLSDADGFVVSRAVNSLKDADLAIAAQPLAKTAEQHPDLAGAVAEALTTGGNVRNKATPLLRDWLKHADGKFRASAITALGKISELDEANELLPALSDPVESVRIAAAEQVLHVFETERTKAGDGDGVAPPEHVVPPPKSLFGRAVQFLAEKLATATPNIGAASGKTDLLEVHPLENWLIQFRAGADRPQWMSVLHEPLAKMLKSESPAERAAGAIPLLALGNDDAALPELQKLAQAEPARISQIAKSLHWLPWEKRAQFFGVLRDLSQEAHQLGELCEHMVKLGDTRASKMLWDVLASEKANAELAQVVFFNLAQNHGLDLYANDSERPKPLGLHVDSLREFASSGGEWQRRVALGMLMQVDESAANEVAQKLADDETATPGARAEAFCVVLLSNSPKAAEQLAAAAITTPESPLQRPALAYLSLGESGVQTLGEGSFVIEHRRSRFSFDGDDKKPALPKELTADQLRRFLTGADADAAAQAAFLLALLGESDGLDRLIARWRKARHANDGNEWEKLVVEAISTSDDARYVPVLEEIYQSKVGERAFEVRELYWSIRSMHGPEILKLRKRIRDEVGMDQLR